MITEMKPDQLTELGVRYRADYLVEQSGYTLGLAAKDGAGLSSLLPAKYLAEARSEQEKVTAAMKDKTLMASEAKNATNSQNAALASAKIWRKRVMHRCQRARQMGKSMPDELVRISAAKTIPEIIGQVDKMVKLLEANKAALAADTAAVIKNGQEIATALKEADTNQELKRLSELPAAVRAFYLDKGTLYIALKVINSAGRELYADKPEAASAYNLSILHRHGGARKVEEKKTETSVTK